MGVRTTLVEEENVCPNCGIEVYQAEALLGGNNRWHKRCFKCCMCNKFLNPSNVSVYEGFLFCRHCYQEVTVYERPQTYYDTAVIKADKGFNANGGGEAGQLTRNCCPRCRGAVYEAEKVTEKGLDYHKRCFTCVQCKRPQDDKLQVFVGFDSEVYCKVCYPKIWHTPLPLDPSDTAKIRANPEDLDGCPRCQGKVFEAEKMSVTSGVFHKQCFSCKICARPMDFNNSVSHEREIFCRTCFHQYFDMRSKSVGPGDTSVIKGSGGSKETCPRCAGVVFEAERVSARATDFHRNCLSCAACAHKLDASSFFDGPDGDVYCGGCYSVRYGHRSRNRSVGPIDTKTIQAGDDKGCPRCGGVVFEAERLSANGRHFHKSTCSTCRSCKTKLDTLSLCCAPDGDIYCAGCYSRQFGGAGYRGVLANRWLDETCAMNFRPTQSIDPSLLKAEDMSSGCRRCGGVVFDLERTFSKSGVWHRQCYACTNCKTSLASNTLADCFEHEDGRAYCKACFFKLFGQIPRPSTYTNTSLLKATGGERGCPRCAGAVFEAEKVVAGENVWFHKKCFDCKSCHTKLDSVRAAIGLDGDAFCGTCYKAHLEEERSRANMAKPRNVIPAEPGDPHACPRCQGKVFEAEKMSSRERWYHKHCFNCAMCSHKLDYSNSMEGPNGEVFCKTCYVKEFFTGGRNAFGDARSNPLGSNGAKDSCGRCTKQVFEVDKVISKSALYHKQCLNCADCSRILDSTNFYDGPTDVFCGQCYSDKYGVRGRGTSSSVDTKRIMADDRDDDKCPRCGGKVFEAEKVRTGAGSYHPACCKCLKCGSNLDQSSAFCGSDGEVYCSLCYKEEFGVLRRRLRSRSVSRSRPKIEEVDASDETDQVAKAAVSTTTIMAASGDKRGCPRCRGMVFEAEKMTGSRGVYHKKCFQCEDCKRALEPLNACEAEMEAGTVSLFCKNCYNKKFGPTAARAFDAEAARKSMDLSRSKPSDPTKACVRCSGAVYAYEELVSNGRAYHRDKCARCNGCDRKLEFATVFGGADKEIYCQGCYARKFGTSGYRGVQSNAWSDEQSCANSRYNSVTITSSSMYQSSSTSTSHGEGGDPTLACVRCGNNVFDAEKVMSSHGRYHSVCYSCADCHVKLDSTRASEAPNKEVYCRGCYGRNFGLHGYGYGGFGSIPALTAVGGEQKLNYHFTQFF